MKALHCLFVSMIPFLLGCEKARLDEQVRELCAKDGGVKVYETVKLPPEKFDKFGVVTIPMQKDAKPADEYYYEWDVQYLKQGNPEMWRSEHRIIRASDKKLLGISVAYVRRGGDIPSPMNESSFMCLDITKQSEFEKSIFFKGESK